MDRDAIEKLKARHAEACNLKQTVDRPSIESAIRKWIAQIGAPSATRIQFISSASEMLKYGEGARARGPRGTRRTRVLIFRGCQLSPLAHCRLTIKRRLIYGFRH